ncbi:hypothetical protein PMI42_05600 [Bradyrhizobium sp. YR681]|uniref:hypothetical protein n=1 Tax=Bradyrhizobium sp. YR681 TaxID=1144344 RepID=UPI00027132A0|nr:hypothetical protein [Bradyrhizobium sp. YR681]EJN11081.1 hypothetical protein PMI42_05600 [Bradyrhizobium sp. YR681]
MKVEGLAYFSDMQEPPEFLKALDHARRLSCYEGWCRMHIEAIQVAIDQYAEAALGNREFFLNKPHSIGASRRNGGVS